MNKQVFSLQQTLDGYIDKFFLRFIPHSVKPNQVTYVRFLLVPVVYWLLLHNQLTAALVVFVIAACTDFIDGAMARTRNQITDIGKVIDPIADKLLILTVLMHIGLKLLLIRVIVIFIIFELITVVISPMFSFVVGKPIGANVFGKIKLILQSFSIGFFLLGKMISNQFLVLLSGYLLFGALMFAVVAALETARRKLFQIQTRVNNISSEKTN